MNYYQIALLMKVFTVEVKTKKNIFSLLAIFIECLISYLGL